MTTELLKRKLGYTDFEVTALSFGTMNLKYLPDEEAESLLHKVLDLGINYIDTSRAYGNSEERIGRYLSGRRDEIIVATKCGCNPHLDRKGSSHVLTFDRATLERNLENSLRALKTDCIDIWQLHGATPEKLIGGPEGEVVEFMQKMKQQGKVRYIGVSIRHGPKTEPGYPSRYGYECIQEYPDWNVFDLFQIVYGGMVRTSEELLQDAADKGAGILVRGVVRDYFDDFPDVFAKAGLDELLAEGEDRRSFLIRYALSHPAVSSVLIGTNNQEHLKANVIVASAGGLEVDRYNEAKKRFETIGSKPGFFVGGIPAESPMPVSS
ncbi:MAG: aldo/keto reductase [Prochloraceae cyanobacterium]|nr:aldo/keto reductase [Prochloraceae cyanobacterium]